MIHIVTSLIVVLLSVNPSNPEELGKVHWNRDYEKALELSKENNKPVFILFQEVPGCSTCKNYGNNILSHPFMVEAIEDEFVPLVIYNNKGGKDAEILKKYGEPTWNNPVVRIVNSQGADIVNRLAEDYSMKSVVDKILEAKKIYNRTSPKYLQLFAEELAGNDGLLKESFISMYCFWTGEKVLGNIKGVAETEAGYMDGREVVKIKYNPNIIEYEDILCEAILSECADNTFTNDKVEREATANVIKKDALKLKDYTVDRTQKYYLANTNYQYLPMTKLQTNRINGALGNQQSAQMYLSPRQKKVFDYFAQNKKARRDIVYNKIFQDQWWQIYEPIIRADHTEKIILKSKS